MGKVVSIMLGLALLLAMPSNADLKLTDVPNDHWAASSVYDLVKLGVTKGFPDGTYRGNKNINRYEIAVFLSKLAKSLGGESLQPELKQIKDQIVELQKAPKSDVKTSGQLYSRWIYANPFSSSGASRGIVSDYRLIVSTSKEISEGVNIKVNLDTMDYGFLATVLRRQLFRLIFWISNQILLFRWRIIR
ncbi:MAG: S-layer homology domain-containing protein [Candidatus Margulisiibacteriota bacterium]